MKYKAEFNQCSGCLFSCTGYYGRCKACYNIWVMYSKPTRCMDVYLRFFCVCVVLRRQRPCNGTMPAKAVFPMSINKILKSERRKALYCIGVSCHTRRGWAITDTGCDENYTEIRIMTLYAEDFDLIIRS
jgi:hypothetical protein